MRIVAITVVKVHIPRPSHSRISHSISSGLENSLDRSPPGGDRAELPPSKGTLSISYSSPNLATALIPASSEYFQDTRVSAGVREDMQDTPIRLKHVPVNIPRSLQLTPSLMTNLASSSCSSISAQNFPTSIVVFKTS